MHHVALLKNISKLKFSFSYACRTTLNLRKHFSFFIWLDKFTEVPLTMLICFLLMHFWKTPEGKGLTINKNSSPWNGPSSELQQLFSNIRTSCFCIGNEALLSIHFILLLCSTLVPSLPQRSSILCLDLMDEACSHMKLLKSVKIWWKQQLENLIHMKWSHQTFT